MTTQTTSTDQTEANRALKAKHRAMWALGNYPAVHVELIAEFGPILVEATEIQAGDRVLDIAAGSGNVAIPAALTGASVIASDLTPELFDTGRQLAAERGAELTWEQADAEALPYADGEFDKVVSAVGIMFAPHHQVAADELLRVCRPGGTIGLISWTPEGFVGQMFAAMKPFAPPPPPGAQPPPLWGSEDHVRSLLGDRVTEVVARKQVVSVDRFEKPADFREYFKTNYGPTIATYKFVGDDPERVAALDAALDAVAARHEVSSGVTEWEYLLLTARKHD